MHHIILNVAALLIGYLYDLANKYAVAIVVIALGVMIGASV